MATSAKHVWENSSLRGQLAQLDSHQRIAFAASCAERAYPVFQIYWASCGRPDMSVLRRMLDRTWRSVDTKGPTPQEIKSLGEELTPLVPDMDESRNRYAAYALNSAVVIEFAFQCAETGDIELAWESVKNLRSIIWNLAKTLRGPRPISHRTCDPMYQVQQQASLEKYILSHPIMVSEFEIEQADLRDLEKGADLTNFRSISGMASAEWGKRLCTIIETAGV